MLALNQIGGLMATPLKNFMEELPAFFERASLEDMLNVAYIGISDGCRVQKHKVEITKDELADLMDQEGFMKVGLEIFAICVEGLSDLMKGIEQAPDSGEEEKK